MSELKSSSLCTLCITIFYVNDFRKRGGSVDNLLDDLGGDVIITGGTMTRESKKKSLSTKNLSLNTNAAMQPAAGAESESATDKESE